MDDYFPCSSRSLAFSEVRSAYLVRSLARYVTSDSWITEALTTLTGAACETEALQPESDDGPAIDTELLWAKLVSDKAKVCFELYFS